MTCQPKWDGSNVTEGWCGTHDRTLLACAAVIERERDDARDLYMQTEERRGKALDALSRVEAERDALAARLARVTKAALREPGALIAGDPMRVALDADGFDFERAEDAAVAASSADMVAHGGLALDACAPHVRAEIRRGIALVLRAALAADAGKETG